MNRILRFTALSFILAMLVHSTSCYADNEPAQDYNWEDDFRCFLRPQIRVIREEDPFSPKEWKDALTTPNPGDGNSVCRRVQFRQFLRDYNLIGMSRKQVIELLGPDDFSGHYTILAGPCRAASVVCIRYGNDDIVTGWRFEGGSRMSGNHAGDAGRWISKNGY